MQGETKLKTLTGRLSCRRWPGVTERTFAEPLVQSLGGQRSFTGEPSECLWRPYRGVEEELAPISSEDRSLYKQEEPDVAIDEDPFDV